MTCSHPPLFRKRQFEPVIIGTCVRWYPRFSLSLRDSEELMAERGLAGHTTIWRWCQVYGPEVLRRLQGEVKRKRSTWHIDETFVRIACSALSSTTARQSTSICRKHGIGSPPNVSVDGVGESGH
jgi:putative transposase